MSSEQSKFNACFLFLGEPVFDGRLVNIARTLSAAGKKICIIAIGIGKDVSFFENDGIIFYYIDIPLKGRTWLRWLRFLYYARLLFKKVKADSYWAEDIYTLYPAYRLSKMHNSKLIYDSREIYSALGPLHKHPFKQKILTLIEKCLIRHSDEILVTGERDGEFLQKTYRLEHNIRCILNLPQYQKPVQSDYLRKNFGIPSDKKILLYQGMIHPGRGLIPIVNTLPLLHDFVLCIVGEGEFKPEVEAEAQLNGVTDRVIFCGKVNYFELHGITCSADIGLSFIEPISYSYSLALPNKLFEYCMAGMPSLISDLPAQRDVWEKFQFGEILPADASAEEIAASINNLSDTSLRVNYVEQSLKAAKFYCFESQRDTLLQIMNYGL
ncbi:MAG: glycosyl transferase group 1 [Ignavibacteria bacterium]|nr:glycosyl transferase group 1 [Ignavibacteria bacterium]